MKTLITGGPALLVCAMGAAAPAAAEPFVGPRVEAVIGLDQLSFDLSRFGIDDTETESDLMGGFAVGYDMPLRGNLIAGLEAGVTFSGVEHEFDGSGATHLLDPRRDIELSARLGTRLSDNGLVYVKAGYSNLRLREETMLNGLTTSETYNLDGVRLGAGAEVAIMPNAYLKSEYRFTAYDDDVESNQILTGIGLRF